MSTEFALTFTAVFMTAVGFSCGVSFSTWRSIRAEKKAAEK